MSEEQNKQKDDKALYIGGVMLINGWKIYTPEDDECVVVIEDSFKTKKTMDVDGYIKIHKDRIKAPKVVFNYA